MANAIPSGGSPWPTIRARSSSFNAALRTRGRVLRCALARRLPLPGLRPSQRLGTGDQGVHLGVRRLRQADVGHRRDGDARIEAAAHRLVLGGVSDGHPFQRHRRPAIAKATGARLVQVGLAAVRQAAPRHGGARPRAAFRPGGDRRDDDPLPHQGRSAGRRARTQRRRQDARRRGGGGARRRTRPTAAGTDRGLLRREPARLHQNPTSRPAPPPRPMAGLGIPPLPA